ncbi:hypothetical protein OsJ_29303 [Oryza sativa Japonica Group]|nr:hypothetical protein OsJ_29303 [Oryza sativa Japonica Group]
MPTQEGEGAAVAVGPPLAPLPLDPARGGRRRRWDAVRRVATASPPIPSPHAGSGMPGRRPFPPAGSGGGEGTAPAHRLPTRRKGRRRSLPPPATVEPSRGIMARERR